MSTNVPWWSVLAAAYAPQDERIELGSNRRLRVDPAVIDLTSLSYLDLRWCDVSEETARAIRGAIPRDAVIVLG
jgi:hypothetical protein